MNKKTYILVFITKDIGNTMLCKLSEYFHLQIHLKNIYQTIC